jgi:hypothetical protein
MAFASQLQEIVKSLVKGLTVFDVGSNGMGTLPLPPIHPVTQLSRTFENHHFPGRQHQIITCRWISTLPCLLLVHGKFSKPADQNLTVRSPDLIMSINFSTDSVAFFLSSFISSQSFVIISIFVNAMADFP